MDPRTQALVDQLRGTPEATATLLTGAVAEPLAGLHGLGQGAMSLLRGRGAQQAAQDAAQRVESTREALTYQPRSESGQRALQGLGQTMQPVAEALNRPADWLGENVSPEAGASLAGLAAVIDPTKGAGRMTAAQARALGYWHPIGIKKKLAIPFSEMTQTSTPGGLPLVPEKRIKPEDIALGTRILSAAGDRSDAGRMITSIGGRQLADPVLLEGGQKFLRTHAPYGSAWASNKGEITKLLRRAREAGEGGDPVWMAPVTMGHNSLDFNTMMTDALIEQLRAAPPSAAAIRAFDDTLRQGTPKAPGRPEWLGLMHEGARQQLDKSGALRVPFVNRMGLDEFVNAGFPDIAQTRFAITDPDLMDAPLYAGGRSFASLDPSAGPIRDPAQPHSSYNTQAAGQYQGGFGADVPKEIMFMDWARNRRAQGIPERGDVRSFQLGGATQVVTPEWQDRMMQFLGY